ncbi:hypothetical protein BDZ89DRAFT_1065585 [Hymenopellis radicata]|nr:hypothetical protein BDZ89DRAFT_1065585 [Hymenopellis radicata]
MSLAPTSQVGKILLQPAYFTSSCYVETMKSDIDALVKTFEGEYAESEEKNKPFTLFKTVWCAMGWQWLHFKVFDARARDMFLQVTCRLFLGIFFLTRSYCCATHGRLVAFFALYTFLNTQPSGAPPLHAIEHIPIPRDQYRALFSLSDAFETSLRAAAINITRLLVDADVFYIIPDSSLGTQYPRVLPREVIVHDTSDAPKKKGRPSKADRVQKSQQAVDSLGQWLEQTGAPSSSEEGAPTTHRLLVEDPTDLLQRYRDIKSTLLSTVAEDRQGTAALIEANKQVYYRLKRAAELNGESEMDAESEGPGIPRVERAMVLADAETGDGPRGGLLGLLEGAGNLNPR